LTAVRGARRYDAVLPFVAMEGETTPAKAADYGYLFVHTARKISYAKYIKTKDESCLFDQIRFAERW
jgi:hypothetical protein